MISFLSFFAPGCTAHISHGKGGGSGSGRQLGFNQLQIGWRDCVEQSLSLLYANTKAQALTLKPVSSICFSYT